MKAKFVFEELVGTFKGEHTGKFNNPYAKDWRQKTDVEVYKNPKSIKRMGSYNRAISDSEGNLYVADDHNILHSELRNFLKIPYEGSFNWTRYARSNMFYPAESDFYAGEPTAEEMAAVEETRKRHPQFSFQIPEVNPWH